MTFGVVPAGKRLVIEHFSAQIYNNTGGPPFHAKLIAEAASTSWFPIRSIQMNRTCSIPTSGCLPTPGQACCSKPISTAKDIWRRLFKGTSDVANSIVRLILWYRRCPTSMNGIHGSGRQTYVTTPAVSRRTPRPVSMWQPHVRGRRWFDAVQSG